MQIGFICPDGTSVRHEDCLSSCRMGKRCLSLPTLRHLAKRRVWRGVPSVTQLLNGTRLEYLRIVKDYYVDPRGRAFALLGLLVHEDLASESNGLFLVSEQNLTISLGASLRMSILSGIPDLYDVLTETLYDYKTWGSYAISMLDAKKEPVRQLNAYRIMLESRGHGVREMYIQAIVRDGGTWLAKKRGVEILMDLFLIPIIEDRKIISYFRGKAKALKEALVSGYCPPCSPEDRWYNRRCQGYCEVSKFCEMGG